MAAQAENRTNNGRTHVIVATSVMLSFMSFWRAAAIVLNDLGSSAYYVGGIAEKAVGRSAPWFILGVMLFSYAVRDVHARRRLPRCQRSNGRHPGEAVGLGVDVRLHPHGSDLRCCGRTIHSPAH